MSVQDQWDQSHLGGGGGGEAKASCPNITFVASGGQARKRKFSLNISATCPKIKCVFFSKYYFFAQKWSLEKS